MRESGKLRSCPALGTHITNAECGQKRNSQIACTADCPFNPFVPRNYHTLLKLEHELNEEFIDWLTAENPGLVQTLQKRFVEELGAESPTITNLMNWVLFFNKDENSTTVAQRIERALAGSMRNDHRVLLQAMMRTEIRLVEVHRVLDNYLVEAIDLLSSQREPFLILDNAFAGRATRFTALLAWVFPLPHFFRFNGILQMISPIFDKLNPDEVVREIATHMHGPANNEELRRWLAEHCLEFVEALENAHLARYQLMINSMDARVGTAVYSIAKPYEECTETLDRIPEVESDDLTENEVNEDFTEARVWFEANETPPDTTEPANLRAVLGRVIMSHDVWHIQAPGSARFKDFREKFERTMGNCVRFVEESFTDYADYLNEKEISCDPSKAPPRLLQDLPRIRLVFSRSGDTQINRKQTRLVLHFLDEYDRKWLGRPVDALGGLSPEQAAHDEKWRPTLVRMMKQVVRMCDEQNLEKGTNRDVNWMLTELGLAELVFDPPPPRPRPID